MPDRRGILIIEITALKGKQVPPKISLPILQLHLRPEPLPSHQELVMILSIKIVLFSDLRKNPKLKIIGELKLIHACFTIPDTTVRV